jgi:phosphopantothenoylcysteine decarboxylase / phosphopantothenate---cysteine ligase
MPSSKSLKILITAGPTREMLDPVRFLSNVSTGEMGYTLARNASLQGHEVTLISGPTALQPPKNVNFISITSAAELQKACRKHFPKHDVLIMTAAVCDFTPASPKKQKIKRLKTKQFLLKQTPDIVAGLASKKGNRTVIGFCLETQNWLKNARKKVQNKHLDGIVANYYNANHIPFGRRRINTAFMDRQGKTVLLKNRSKDQVSKALLGWIRNLR